MTKNPKVLERAFNYVCSYLETHKVQFTSEFNNTEQRGSIHATVDGKEYMVIFQPTDLK